MDKTQLLEAVCATHHIRCAKDVMLGEYCTFKIGGPADMMIWPNSQAQLAMLLPFLKEEAIRSMVLGRGSNVLFSDKGFRGAVICLGSDFAEIRRLDDKTVACDSGVTLLQLCRYALGQGLAGLEFAFGIPGSVGGAAYMNAGAYGGEMKDVLLSVGHLTADGIAGRLEGTAMDLSYRHSAYTDTGMVITEAVLGLQPGAPEAISARMEDYMGRRKSKQPLEYPSVGSTFRRPVGAFASALIDECGLKGRRVGGAMVSEKHAGFLINTGNATCADMRALIEIVQREVAEKTGHLLECEIKVIGE